MGMIVIVRLGLRIQPVDATLLLLTQFLVCCIHRLNPHRIPDGQGQSNDFGRSRLKFYFSAFTHESFKVTVRLNTGAPGLVSTRSATK